MFNLRINYKNLIAFTLAEILITLGIIGVVAALTMPTLMSNIQKNKIETQLKHSYATIQQVFKMAEVDHGDMAGWGLTNGTIKGNGGTIMNNLVNTYMLPYLSGASFSKSAIQNIGYTDGIKYPDGTTWLEPTAAATSLRLKNGVNLFFGTGGMIVPYPGGIQIETTDSFRIYIDVNGNGKPNVLGKDIFVMAQYAKSSKMYMLGEMKQEYPETASELQQQINNNTFNFVPQSRAEILSKCEQGNTNSIFCGALIKMNGWKIPNDYPWLK